MKRLDDLLEECMTSTSMGLASTSNYVGTNNNVSIGTHVIGRPVPEVKTGNNDLFFFRKTKKKKKKKKRQVKKRTLK